MTSTYAIKKTKVFSTSKKYKNHYRKTKIKIITYVSNLLYEVNKNYVPLNIK